jgi:hypothetical protein
MLLALLLAPAWVPLLCFLYAHARTRCPTSALSEGP